MHVSIYRIITLIFAAFALSSCGQQPADPQAAAEGGLAASSEQPAEETEVVEITELQIIDTVDGDGAEAQAGQEVVVHYTGWLYEPGAGGDKGEKFDSSVDRGDPFAFSLGAGQVISGWDQGVAGMKVGGKRTLIIPPDMAYGDRGAGAVIPPGATLVFDVELLNTQ